ncbi:MAG: esterase family protein [Sphingobacteriaceae bacterium]|nr:MAG: esterase family protein [Sphingobacteriaceae bacterium]
MVKNVKTLFWVMLIFALKAHAAKIDTVLIHSTSMNKDVKTVVVCPTKYSKSKHYPVLYLLHGFSGNYADWIKKDTELNQFADNDQVIIVCPDGNFASWYMDSPEHKDLMYDTYLSKELVNWIDLHYTTINSREGRAITGLSMGGFGALHAAIKHPDVFGAVGSMSGGVDLRPFADAFGIKQILGEYKQYPQRWDENSIINMLYLIKPNSLAITFTCGHEDFFHPINDDLDSKMWQMKIPHDYSVRPGGHTWEYWTESLKYQMVFFNQFFNKLKV